MPPRPGWLPQRARRAPFPPTLPRTSAAAVRRRRPNDSRSECCGLVPIPGRVQGHSYNECYLFFQRKSLSNSFPARWRRVSKMRTLIGVVVAAGLAAIGLGFWLSSATQSATEVSSVPTPTTVSQISISEIHNLAHLEFLPIQQIEDQSLIFTEAERQSSK